MLRSDDANGWKSGGCGFWSGFGTTPTARTTPSTTPAPYRRVDSRSHGVAPGGMRQYRPSYRARCPRGCRPTAGRRARPSRARQADQPPCDDDALDLTRALDDVHRLDVAVELLDVAVGGDARVAEDVDGEARRLLRDPRGEGLRHGQIGRAHV